MNSMEMSWRVANDFGTLYSTAQTMSAALDSVKACISFHDSVETRAALSSIEFALNEWKGACANLGVLHGLSE